MNLFSKRNIKNLFKKYQGKPLKKLGQNFLIDKGVVKKVIEATELKPNDTVLEIGPGIGTLTIELAKRVHPVKSRALNFVECSGAKQFNGVKQIIAIEKDPKMIEILKETMKDFQNVKIIQADILKLNTKYKIQDTRYKIIANLPFYLTAPVIRVFVSQKQSMKESPEVCRGPSSAKPHLLETPFKPKMMVLIVQKEVAQRICAKPGKMSILAVSVQFYAKAEIISYISKKSFWPQPKVDSAIIKIVPRRFRVSVSRQFRERFFRIVKAGFSQPRKQLINNLSKDLKIDKIKARQWLMKNKIQPSQRAETLTIENWLKLTETFNF